MDQQTHLRFDRGFPIYKQHEWEKERGMQDSTTIQICAGMEAR
jgi:hypothetical protein